VVVDDVVAAARLIAAGQNVVLVVDPDGDQVAWPSGGPGRLAVLVGSVDDPAVRAAAEVMAAELFGTG
jgi:hypothetical protein